MGVIRLHLAGGRMILVLVLNANLKLQEQSNNQPYSGKFKIFGDSSGRFGGVKMGIHQPFFQGLKYMTNKEI